MNKPARPEWMDTYETGMIGFRSLDECQLLVIIACASYHYQHRAGGSQTAEALRDLADACEAGLLPVIQP